jgi:hypothetical protein
MSSLHSISQAINLKHISIKKVLITLILTFTLIALAIFTNSCSFAHGGNACEAPAEYPLSIKSQSNVNTVFESAGSLIVFHGWISTDVNLTIDHKDGTCEETIIKYFLAVDRGITTALAAFPTFLKNSIFLSVNKLGILPRGFGINWNSGDDHNLWESRIRLL